MLKAYYMGNFCIFYKAFIIPNVAPFEIYGNSIEKGKTWGFIVSIKGCS